MISSFSFNKKINVTESIVENAKPKVEIDKESRFFESDIKQLALKVKYECNPMSKVASTITMTVEHPECTKMTFSWRKMCGVEKKDNEICIGSNPNTADILDKGIVNPKMKMDDKQKSELIITKDLSTFSFFINHDSGVPDRKLVNTHLTFNEEALGIELSGSLANGGFITSQPQELKLIFNCVPGVTLNVETEITLTFDNLKEIILFFRKECAVEEEIAGYFSFISVVFW